MNRRYVYVNCPDNKYSYLIFRVDTNQDSKYGDWCSSPQGRKDQLGLVMITRNPDDIDSDILKQTNINIFLHLREEVIEDVPSVPRGYRRDIPKFGKGQAVIKAPVVEAVEAVGLSYCLTRHDS